jgi:hypothetical protein
MDALVARLRVLDPASRALLDLSLRRRLRDDDMAPVLRLDPFNLAWRRARAIERLASQLGLHDPAGLAWVRGALPHVPASAWCVPLALEAGEPAAGAAAVSGDVAPEASGDTAQGAGDTTQAPADAAQALGDTGRASSDAPAPADAPAPVVTAPSHRPPAPSTALVRRRPAPPHAQPPAERMMAAVSAARTAAVARPGRRAILAGAGALLGALLSRRRR